MSEIAKRDEAAPAVIEPNQILTKVMELASNPDINPEMFDRLVAWQERETARQAEMAYNEAMNRAQAEIAPVARDAENSQTHSFYAKLETVDAAIRPIYLKHGFSLSYNTVAPLTPGNIRVECRCAHSGHSERFYREAAPDTTGPQGKAVKTALHGGGSTETYLKRYLVCGIFNVVFKGMDTDGQARGAKTLINAEQKQILVDLMQIVDPEPVKFFAYCGVQTLDQLPLSEYPRVLGSLRKKAAEINGAAP